MALLNISIGPDIDADRSPQISRPSPGRLWQVAFFICGVIEIRRSRSQPRTVAPRNGFPVSLATTVNATAPSSASSSASFQFLRLRSVATSKSAGCGVGVGKPFGVPWSVAWGCSSG